MGLVKAHEALYRKFEVLIRENPGVEKILYD
jgi:hypothetical protein